MGVAHDLRTGLRAVRQGHRVLYTRYHDGCTPQPTGAAADAVATGPFTSETTSPAAQPTSTPTPTPTPVPHGRGEVSRELTGGFTGITSALISDRTELARQVLLWQRWPRYAAAALVACVAFATAMGTYVVPWAPVALAAGSYILFHVALADALRRGSGTPLRGWVPLVAVVTDVVFATAVLSLTSSPAQLHRILLLGCLVVQIGVFYFGGATGVWAAALLVVAYISASLYLPASVPGPRPTLLVVAFNLFLFLVVAAFLVRLFGRYHARMAALRGYLKRAEMGDLAGIFPDDEDRSPDDLTLLGRSFNEMRSRLIELIGTDPLTGCLNRRALETRLGREWRQAKRRGSPLAVLAVDVDFFKEINDTHGHPAGDVVLHELGDIMRATCRDTDVVARLGGDEFVILLPDTPWQGAMTFAERLRRNVDDHEFASDRTTLDITISVGVALARGTDPLEANDLLEQADRSLYKAKAGGRNRICA
ncbi:MAG: hypothetical protein NVS1B4_24650 [Gemmatimonadaceae bacterium]